MINWKLEAGAGGGELGASHIAELGMGVAAGSSRHTADRPQATGHKVLAFFCHIIRVHI